MFDSCQRIAPHTFYKFQDRYNKNYHKITLHFTHFLHPASGSVGLSLFFWVAILFKFLGWLKQTCLFSPIFLAFSFLTRHFLASLNHMFKGGFPLLCVKIILIFSSFLFFCFLFCWMRSFLGFFFASLSVLYCWRLLFSSWRMEDYSCFDHWVELENFFLIHY